ncbi:transcriptional repressor [Desulfosporosinus fructosivorans]|uniref:Transcriptional repressor n=1 Tax=Desulfosporosinus fructosivorans TaxID=2018669 RepID=A0A4Z0R5K8_9FIRM|nr:Fur family transcriptional regulator [Desulfosporosinus fructosivorans]TGE38391.1 transcriptional repressor [Desulfosporosinus fructosivorans]
MILLEENTNYTEILKREGMKSTRHRNAILLLLEQSEHPITAEELYISLKGKTATINLSTVYRTLDTFASKNLVIKSTMDDGKARYELNHHEHKHHLFCVGCHKVISIEDCPMGELQESLKKKIDFDVTGHKLEIYGYCHNCKKG